LRLLPAATYRLFWQRGEGYFEGTRRLDRFKLRDARRAGAAGLGGSSNSFARLVGTDRIRVKASDESRRITRQCFQVDGCLG